VCHDRWEYDWYRHQHVDVEVSYCTGRTIALESFEGESAHAPAGLYEIKGEASSAESDQKKVNDVAMLR
jgi:hypothetical protein